VIARAGDDGRAWLARLPHILDACARRWGLTFGSPITALSYNFVVAARDRDGTVAILKVHAPPDEGGFAHERDALHAFDGHGAVRLLASDMDDQALLLEQCVPGTPLGEMTVEDDARATSIACAVMRALWRMPPAGYQFPTMADWNNDLHRLRPHFGGGTGPFPERIIAEMESLLADLTASAGVPLLLHGDLHHDNIVMAGREPWLAIDPKGLIGEPAYEIGPLLFNPQPQLLAMPQPRRILARRVDQCAEELGLDRARVRGWGLVRSVLAAWWDAESSGHDWKPALTCAALIAEIPG
jgi:streptomycin 6-kinase